MTTHYALRTTHYALRTTHYALRLRSNSVKTPGLYGYAGVVVHRSASLASMYSFADENSIKCRYCWQDNFLCGGFHPGKSW
ncbi:MAG: hypothetical protein FJ190_00420 [Gammaproteobacteria bacterium]|nr:hypothetical protein [Gammaproteobacteria bacterium]